MDRNNLSNFYQVVDDIIGMYYDSRRGFISNYQATISAQSYFVNNEGISIEILDKTEIAYVPTAPILPPEHPDTLNLQLYTTTQGRYKEKNQVGGGNHIVMGNLAICQLYSYWEDYYRGRIAEDLGVLKNDFKREIFGDIRLLRNSIVHHRSIALKEISKCHYTKWFIEGDEIAIDCEKFEFIMLHVKESILDFERQYNSLIK
jgi:hypothetical protein